MLCIRPIGLKNGNVVPCGQCRLCREEKRRTMALRAVAEAKLHKDSIFLTLTYDDEHLPPDNSVHKRDVQLFLKRLRKATGTKLRYLASGEYGERSGRCHYHLIVYGIPKNSKVFYDFKYPGSGMCRCKVWSDPKTHDSLGWCFVGDVNYNSCKYVAKYVVKKYVGRDAKQHYAELGIEPEFCLVSRKPGLGFGYLEKNLDTLADKEYTTIAGHKSPLPRYFVDKIKEAKEGFDFYLACKRAEKQSKVSKQMFEQLNRFGLRGRDHYQVDTILQKEANFKAKERLFTKKGALDV